MTGQSFSRAAEGQNPGQHPVWALISTALLAGFLWYLAGPYWAAGAVVGVFVHEYGHVLAMNRLGCGPARIFIIPFLGGAAMPARPAKSEFHDVLISLAGPAFGLLAAIPFLLLSSMTGHTAWLGGALAVAFINLINLAPAPPLDGSRALGPALARIHPMVEKAALLLVGLAAIAWAISNGSYIFALFLGLAGFGALRAGRLRPPSRPLSGTETGLSVLLYLLTAALCAGALLFVLMQGAAR